MKIYLIRHTSVDVPLGVCYGQTDVPLNNTFQQEAQEVKKRLLEIHADAVFSSPLSRCTRLAHYCGFVDSHLDNRLKEMNFGDWEYRKWTDIDMSIWKANWSNVPAPGGESFKQMYDRVSSFFNELKTKEYNTVFVFCHGGVIGCSRVYFQQIDINNAFNDIPKYGSIVEFELK